MAVPRRSKRSPEKAAPAVRYPFLDSGTTPEVHQAIMEFLEQHDYRVAHVTVDYKDYSFAGMYTRLLRAGDAATADRVKQAYLDQIDPGFEHAENASQEILGYELPQILLIHCNELNSVTLAREHRTHAEARLRVHHARGSHERPRVCRRLCRVGGSWLERIAKITGLPRPRRQ